MTDTGMKMPGYLTGTAALYNLTRGGIDSSQQTTPMDKARAFTSTGFDLLGTAASYFKPCSAFTKMVPLASKGVNVYDLYQAKKGLDAERSNPNPDMAKIKGHQRTMFINGMDLVSPPFLPVGTIVSTTVDVGTYMVKNPPVFKMPSAESVDFMMKHGF